MRAGATARGNEKRGRLLKKMKALGDQNRKLHIHKKILSPDWKSGDIVLLCKTFQSKNHNVYDKC
jgi:hypothetical protein